ncbi:uncharacterized protein N7500_009342 [Penicillium coprophilum]|uniref:uncharacterized protein n=1 Tax=Penicillium coprophilum TaxID=36646 RepID=UPI00238C138B|nr:uncharacterized protein N7500_009342 [Penicillium coprophilum]KAJ5153903.1 hypothetical protein N7500_009342 [Penicillium coprophilum]
MSPREDVHHPVTMQCYSNTKMLSTSIITSSPSSSSSSSSTSDTFVSSHPSSTTFVSSGIYDSSESNSLSFSRESMTVHTSEGVTSPLHSMDPLRQETAEMEILGGIAQLAAMIDRKDDLDDKHNEERDRLASGIEDTKVLLGLHLCRIEDELTRQVLLETFLLHLGPTDAPWMLAPLLARLARGI